MKGNLPAEPRLELALALPGVPDPRRTRVGMPTWIINCHSALPVTELSA